MSGIDDQGLLTENEALHRIVALGLQLTAVVTAAQDPVPLVPLTVPLGVLQSGHSPQRDEQLATRQASCLRALQARENNARGRPGMGALPVRLPGESPNSNSKCINIDAF